MGVQKADVDEDIDHLGADFVPGCLHHNRIGPEVQLGDHVEQVYLLYFAVLSRGCRTMHS